MNKKYLSILLLLSFVFTFFNLNSSYAARKPDIVSHDAELLEDAISFNVEWQSDYPVVQVIIAAGNKTKKIELDEYDDNVRDSYGYHGEASLVFEIGEIGIFDEYVTYVIQLEDDLGRRSRRVTGKVKVPEMLIGGRRDREDDKIVDEYVDKSPSQKPVGVIDKVLDVMARHDTPPNIKHIKVNKYGNEGVSISSEAIDDKGLRNITIRILDQSGNIAGEEILADLGKIWKGTSKTFALQPGVYKAVAQAVDTGGNTSKERSEQFVIEAVGDTGEQKFGALIVTIAPEVVFSAGAQWKVDGGDWQNSGTTVSNLPAGKHTIEFKDIAAWAKPGNQEIEIKESQTSEATGTYTQDFGALVVTIDPEAAVIAGAQWKVDNGDWHSSGTTVSDLSVGAHIIEFSGIESWAVPGNQNVEIVASQTTEANGTYTQKFGALVVTIDPEAAITAGAQWKVDGGEWQNSGATVSGLSAGAYNIEFKDVAGFIKPSTKSISIQAGQTTTDTASYSIESLKTGSLNVIITPQEVNTIGAKWSIDGTNWHEAGKKIDIAVGPYTVRFSEVKDWETPASQTVEIKEKGTTPAQGNYKRMHGSLTVNIIPEAAVKAGAQWRVNNGLWQNSGATVSGLLAGAHNIDFKDVAGFIKPSGKSISIQAGLTTTETVTVTKQPGCTPPPYSGDRRGPGNVLINFEGASGNAASYLAGFGIKMEGNGVIYSTMESYGGCALVPVSGANFLNGDNNSPVTLTFDKPLNGISVTRVMLFPATPSGITHGVWSMKAFNAAGQEVGSVGEAQIASYQNVPGKTLTIKAAGITSVRIVGNHNGFAAFGFPALDDMVLDQQTETKPVGVAGVVLVRDMYTNSPKASDPPVGKGYAKVTIPGVFDIEGLRRAGTDDIFAKLIAAYVSAGNKNPVQRQVLTYNLQGDYATTGCASQGCDFINVANSKTGSINVIITPQEVNALGAKWSIDGTNWHEAGKNIDIAVGSYTVRFSEVKEWETPPLQTVEIKEKGTTPAQGNYKRMQGSLTVNIMPEAAVKAGAQWRLAGGKWKNSGQTVSGLSAGQHTIEFKEVTGWGRPANQTVNVIADKVADVKGVYQRSDGRSNVSIEGRVYIEGTATPIQGAVVSTSLDSQKVTTNSTGYFFLQTNTPANYSSTPYTITISFPNYGTFNQSWVWGDHPRAQTFYLRWGLLRR